MNPSQPLTKCWQVQSCLDNHSVHEFHTCDNHVMPREVFLCMWIMLVCCLSVEKPEEWRRGWNVPGVNSFPSQPPGLPTVSSLVMLCPSSHSRVTSVFILLMHLETSHSLFWDAMCQSLVSLNFHSVPLHGVFLHLLPCSWSRCATPLSVRRMDSCRSEAAGLLICLHLKTLYLGSCFLK